MTITLNHYCGSFALMSIREKYGSDRITTRGNNMSEPFSGFTGALIMKFGFYKVLGGISAICGACMMSLFRPHETNRSLFLHCLVALGSSFMFGGTVAHFLDTNCAWISLSTASIDETLEFMFAVHGSIGALSWSAWSAVRVFLDRGAKDPVQLAKDVKEVM